MAHVVLDVLLLLGQTIYIWVKEICMFFVPVSWRSKDMKGERVLITGAGSGIGRGMAVKFASMGCHLVVWDINAAGNDETARLCREYGVQVHAYTVDLSERKEIYAAATKVKSEAGDVDVLINNAGIVTGQKLLDCPDQLMETTMRVNCHAHFWTLKSFLPRMLERDHGHVVTIASMAGVTGVNGLLDYCASKFAAIGLHESLVCELHALGKKGVKGTLVCPSYINTGMFDGIKLKWEWLMPFLDPAYVVQRVVEAVQIEQEVLMMPSTMYSLYALKPLMPVKAGLNMSDALGASSMMDSFLGRSGSKKD